MSDFQETFIKIVKTIDLSKTQKMQVAIAEDENGVSKISLQKFWRRGTDDDWKLGKGFLLSKQDSKEVAEGLLKAIEQI